MDTPSKTPLLDQVHTPADVRALPEKSLRQLADELRQETIDAVAVTGGHLGAGLGVVELTVALHHIFETPSGFAVSPKNRGLIGERQDKRQSVTCPSPLGLTNS